MKSDPTCGETHNRHRPVIVQTSVHFSEITCKLRTLLKKICCSKRYFTDNNSNVDRDNG